MARDATARLYDVDEDSVVFNRLNKTESYDQGTIAFQARDGRVIDLDMLHESIWATRLSGRTSSGLISLDVTAIGRLVKSGDRVVLKVDGSDSEFAIAQNPDSDHASAFGQANRLAGEQMVKLSGRIADYQGRWPGILKNAPQKPRQIWVTEVEVLDEANR